MADTRKLTVMLNIGLDDQQRYGIPNGADGETPPKEGETITVDEKTAEILVNVLKCCKDYDAKSEEAHAKKVKADDDLRAAAAQASGLTPATLPIPGTAVKDK